ncbi:MULTISPECIES: choice-of-anchor D domain-containing protein [unclassified Wenzhouxiangella]|uniref:choice-of-anchor D domain-containing protein n=1 Tax=unclassified Wenzhouxiangella TaxID=2613841 RepID=UPI0015F273F3|nr:MULTISPECIES: choice-of-anchor D domain-containing protein [unclassified Wenzhouxiangella]
MSTPKRHPLTLAVAVALGLGTSQVVSAAEFTVTNTDDSGAGSLRSAIGEANASGDASNTVVFDGAVTGTITLDSSIFVESNSLTIQGPGPADLIIEQDGQVLRLSHTAASVAISGLTLRHTDGSTSAEAPLFSHSPSLSIDNVHFRGESGSVTNFGYGGGCLASSQWASQSGGVRELNITNSEFDNCRAASGYGGGAIFAEQTADYGGDLSITIESTTMQNGLATDGAAALIRQSTFIGSGETSHAVTIDGLVANGNEHNSYGGYGTLSIRQGRDSSLDIDNLDMTGNSGRAALALNTGTNSNASIRNASFLNNDAGFDPIVLIDAFGSDVGFELVGSRISNTTSSARMAVEFGMFGGGQNISIRDTLIHGSEFDIGAVGALLDNSGYGGDTFEMVNTTITDNQVGNFALSVDPSSSTVDTDLRHVTITDNTLTGGLQREDERGEFPSAPGMVTLTASGERRITNSIIHGVSGGGQVPQGERGVSAFDLSGTGEVTVDHSLIGTVDETNLTVTDAGGSDIGNNTDPQLLALADNGGLSRTRAFTTDSPAYDAGNPGAANLPAFDQRGDGFPRNAGNAPDMGAFELQVAPAVSLSAEALDFPDTRVQTTSDPLSVEVTNTGDFELNISGVSVGQPLARGASSFAADGSDCTAAAIPPDGSCSIEVTFTPGSRADFSGSLDIATDADPADYSVALTGTGVAPIVNVGPDRDFGAVLTGTTSDAQIVTLANTGDDALEVTGFDPAVEAPFSLDFSDCGTGLPFTVPAGTSCELSTTFEPSATGSAGTTVTVESDSLNTDTNQFSLSGQGVLGQLVVSPGGDIDFGEVPLGESGQTELTLTNEGSAPVTVEDWTNLPDPFSISGDCPEPPFTLEPDESCSLTVTFAPESAGDYEQGLELGSNDGTGADSTQIAVSGRGTAPIEPALPVPTLDRIGLIVGSGLLALMGLFGLRRRRQTPLD